MRKYSPFFPAATIFLILSVRSTALAASTGTDLDREYAQVRKIALRDPRVQDAFEKANQRLDEKILQIDPALKPIVEREERTPAPVAVESARTGSEAHPAASPVPEGRQHIVVKGETLSSIAGHYHVKVAALEKINHITDDRKLRVGQKLVIPAAESPEAQRQDNDGVWDRLKNSL
jgi:LysM repeat protein